MGWDKDVLRPYGQPGPLVLAVSPHPSPLQAGPHEELERPRLCVNTNLQQLNCSMSSPLLSSKIQKRVPYDLLQRIVNSIPAQTRTTFMQLFLVSIDWAMGALAQLTLDMAVLHFTNSVRDVNLAPRNKGRHYLGVTVLTLKSLSGGTRVRLIPGQWHFSQTKTWSVEDTEGSPFLTALLWHASALMSTWA